mgnify:CR=1 FL=1
MNISRFTPPEMLGKGLQEVKNETSEKSHCINYVLSIALAILFLITNFFILNSCSSSDDDDQKKEENVAHYYVKYEVSFPSVSPYEPNVTVGYASEKGHGFVSVKSWSWDGTFGPFKAGTTVYMNASCYRVNGHIASSARLSVCNGKGPFVLKAETSQIGASSLSVDYTIQEND